MSSNLDYVGKAPVLVASASYDAPTNVYTLPVTVPTSSAVQFPLYPYDNWVVTFTVNATDRVRLFVGDARCGHTFDLVVGQVPHYAFAYEGQTLSWDGTGGVNGTHFLPSGQWATVVVRLRNGKASMWCDPVTGGTPGATKVLDQQNTFLQTNTFACSDYGYFMLSNPGNATSYVGGVDIRNLTVFENPTVFSTELYADTLRCGKLAVLGSGSVSVPGAVSAGSLAATGAVSAGTLSASGAVSAGSVAASGAVSAGSVSASGAVSAGSLATGGDTSTGTLTVGGSQVLDASRNLNNVGAASVYGGVNLYNQGVLDLGAGVAGRNTSAGKLGYGAFTAGALDIVGAGTTSGSRLVKLWDNVNVVGGLFMNGTQVLSSARALSNIASATVAGTVSASNYTGVTWAMVGGKPTFATVATSGLYTDLGGKPTLATVSSTGSYTDLLNKPTIPAAQVNSDWSAASGVAQILNKPALATVATSGLYSDLGGRPTLATVATTGSYTDLLNQPTIPAAQVQTDWNATTGLGVLLNKPTIPAAQVSSDWNAASGVAQILNKPAIPAAQVSSDWGAASGVAQILNKPAITATASNSIDVAGSASCKDLVVKGRSSGFSNHRLYSDSNALYLYSEARAASGLMLDANNRVGINTVPTCQLDVNGQGACKGFIVRGNTSGYSNHQIFSDQNSLYLYSEAKAASGLMLDPNNRVGINTTSLPAYQLDVNGATGSKDLVLKSRTAGQSNMTLYADQNSLYFYNGYAGFNGMYMDQYNNVVCTQKLHVGGGYSAAFNSKSTFFGDLAADPSTQVSPPCITCRHDTNYTSIQLQFMTQTSTAGTIVCSGSTTAYNTTSDYRLKDEVRPLEGGAERVKRLKPCSFRFKADPGDAPRIEGFIAHEVAEVVPQAVTGAKDDPGMMQAMDAGKLVPLLTAALQELVARVEALQEQANATLVRVEALQEQANATLVRVEALEEKVSSAV